MVAEADRSDPYNFVEFDYETQRGKISNIVNQASTKSMALSDKFIPGRVFRDDLISMLKDGSYGDLGVDVGDVQSVDPDSDGDGTEFISDGDAITIADALINDNDLCKDYLTEYFTQHAKTNWEKTQYRNKRLISDQSYKTDKANMTSLSKTPDKINADLKLPVNILNQFDNQGNAKSQNIAIKDMTIAQLEHARGIIANNYGSFPEGSKERQTIDKLIELMDARETLLASDITPDQI